MINASQEFKNLVRKGTKLVNYADVTLKDGTVLNLGPSDFSVGGFSMDDKTTNGKFEIGTAIAKNISVTIANHTNKFSIYDFYKSIIYMYVATEKEDGTVLKERKGKYYVINPTTPSDTIRLSGVDSMYLFDRPYNARTVFPATLQTILSDCCIDCGVNISFGEFDNWNYVVMHKPEDCTYRQVVSWVAQIAGYNARINNNDYLELVWYDTSLTNENRIDGGNFLLYDEENIYDGGDFNTYDTDLVIDGGNFTDEAIQNITKISSLSVSTDDVVITGVKVEYDDTSFLYGSEDYIIHVKGNPLTEEKEQEIASYLGKKLIGLHFRPLTCKIPNNPLYEPFDVGIVFDRKGNEYFTLFNSVNYTISGFTTLSCNAEDPVRNESSYVSEAAKAVVQARRNTEKQLTTYDKAVQNMNALASNAMGLYRESETQSDGSVIYYMSNRPITKNDNGICSFEENSVVYKMTGDGFFVSEDGGLSYTSGFDSEGNAVVNVLSAIGITFDWARGGTLSLGGDNNINGSIVVYDSENNVIGKFNKDGLWASNGYFKGDIVSTNAYITGGQINITTSAQTYDTIQLKHGIDIIKISPAYLYQENTYGILLITPNDIALGNGTTFQSSSNQSNLGQGNLTLEWSGSRTYIQGGSASFGGSISVAKTTSLNGETTIAGELNILADVTSPVLFKYPVEIAGTGSLLLNSSATLECRGKATFYNGIYLGTVFSVDTVGNVIANGSIKADSMVESSFYKLSIKDSVSISGNLTANGSVKFGDSTSDSLGFFGNKGSSKKTVSKITTTSTATTTSNATKINEIIEALKNYNLL